MAVTVDELVGSATKADLVEQAEELGLDTDGLNKTELAEAILAEEGELEPDEEAPEDDESSIEVAEVVEEVKEAEADPDREPENVEPPNEEVLVRFTGKNPALQVAGLTFQKKNPFKVLTREQADRVFESRWADRFRVATPKEAEEFYA